MPVEIKELIIRAVAVGESVAGSEYSLEQSEITDKEAIIEEFGVDHFLIRRLSTVDHTFQAAGHFSMFRRAKKLVCKKKPKENEGGSRASRR